MSRRPSAVDCFSDGISAGIQSKCVSSLPSPMHTTFVSLQYFRTLNTRVSVVYVETWGGANQAQIDGSKDISKAISNFNDYTSRNLFKIDKDTTQLLTWVHATTYFVCVFKLTRSTRNGNLFLHYYYYYYFVDVFRNVRFFFSLFRFDRGFTFCLQFRWGGKADFVPSFPFILLNERRYRIIKFN